MERNQLIFKRKYKVLDGQEVARRITKIFEGQCSLSDYQKYWLKSQLGNSGVYGNLDMPFQVYEWEETKSDRTILQYVVTPFILLLNLVILLVVCPIKWLLTGSFLFDSKSKILRWLYDANTWVLGER